MISWYVELSAAERKPDLFGVSKAAITVGPEYRTQLKALYRAN